MTVREEQIALCHFMIDSMRHRRIALCDASTGIGKTYAYLTAAVLFRSCCPSRGAQSITISTATVALQEAICREYLPFLSRVLLKNRVIDRPLYAAVRKGKERFVCDIRLAQRLEAVREKEKTRSSSKHFYPCAESWIWISCRSSADLTAGRYAFPHIVPQIVRVPGAAGTTGICGRSRGARA